MFDTIVAASISFVPEKWGLESNTQRLTALVRQAAAATPKPDLILAPEGILEGYVVSDIYDGGMDAERIRTVALTDDSPPIQGLRSLAAELGVCIAFGYCEAVGQGVYNAAMFVDDTGAICGKYHKLQLAEGYVEGNFYNELGQSGRAFDTPLGRVGFLICNDRWNPDLARLPVLDGAALLLIPSFGSCSPSQDEAVLARARENGVAIVEANVGLLLSVSKGEIVGREDRSDTATGNTGDGSTPAFILLSEVQVPAARTEENYQSWEEQVKEWRGPAMAARWGRTRAAHGEDPTEYDAAANAILQEKGLANLQGLAYVQAESGPLTHSYTLSDLLAAERGAAASGASGDAAELSLAARAGGGDGDEDVIARLAAGDGALPRVLEEAQAHGAARL